MACGKNLLKNAIIRRVHSSHERMHLIGNDGSVYTVIEGAQEWFIEDFFLISPGENAIVHRYGAVQADTNQQRQIVSTVLGSSL
ncbi:hypothetical protein NPIL_685421 [Nephila pilipes]|uniref:Uncharacterized protein n=1 Tax=Nephila pilipes TaxID=299642 RepID=A0A8X6R3X1_NEPPI|nr:hypothetical protein NPIL_685421 [Nephila pilipes]